MHREPTEKDRDHAPDPDAAGYWPEHASLSERDRHEAVWAAAYDRAKSPTDYRNAGGLTDYTAFRFGTFVIPAGERRVANVREVSTVARWVVLVGGTILALLAVVGVAVLWGGA